jgi:hypothetical protein
MQRSANFHPNFSASEMEAAPTFNVVIAYEDFETGKHAKKTYDFLTEHLAKECNFASQMWKFDVLGIPKLREMAARDASSADIIVISCHGTTDLPADVKAWIELWLAEDTHPIALVALFDDPPITAATEALREYLSQVAVRGNMEFFAQPDNWPGSKPAKAHLAIERLAAFPGTVPITAIAAPATSIPASAASTFPRWGINE